MVDFRYRRFQFSTIFYWKKIYFDFRRLPRISSLLRILQRYDLNKFSVNQSGDPRVYFILCYFIHLFIFSMMLFLVMWASLRASRKKVLFIYRVFSYIFIDCQWFIMWSKQVSWSSSKWKRKARNAIVLNKEIIQKYDSGIIINKIVRMHRKSPSRISFDVQKRKQ